MKLIKGGDFQDSTVQSIWISNEISIAEFEYALHTSNEKSQPTTFTEVNQGKKTNTSYIT